MNEIFDQIKKDFDELSEKCDAMIKMCDEEIPMWKGNIKINQNLWKNKNQVRGVEI